MVYLFPHRKKPILSNAFVTDLGIQIFSICDRRHGDSGRSQLPYAYAAYVANSAYEECAAYSACIAFVVNVT